jgi:hypothetical protein
VAVVLAAVGCSPDAFKEMAVDLPTAPSGAVRLEINGPRQIRSHVPASYSVMAVYPSGTRLDVTHEVTFTHGLGLYRPPEQQLARSASIVGVELGTHTLEADFRGLRERIDVEVVNFFPTPLVPTTLIAVDRSIVHYRHVVGSSPCPDALMGTIVTNVTDLPLTLRASSDHPAIEVAGNEVVVPPGEFRIVPIAFNCSATPPFWAKVTLTARTPGGTTHELVVDVRGGRPMTRKGATS